jgi:hypothetical protein
MVMIIFLYGEDNIRARGSVVKRRFRHNLQDLTAPLRMAPIRMRMGRGKFLKKYFSRYNHIAFNIF